MGPLILKHLLPTPKFQNSFLPKMTSIITRVFTPWTIAIVLTLVSTVSASSSEGPPRTVAETVDQAYKKCSTELYDFYSKPGYSKITRDLAIPVLESWNSVFSANWKKLILE